MFKSLGARIRELRKEKKLTLVEISKKTGVAQATLSRIETGSMIGTVESHQKIADVIGVSLAELYAATDPRLAKIDHFKQEDERKVTHHTKNIRVEKEEYVLKSGETLYFDASLPHQITNPRSKTAKLLLTVSPSKI